MKEHLTVAEGDEFRKAIAEHVTDSSGSRCGAYRADSGCRYGCGSDIDDMAKAALAFLGVSEDTPAAICQNCGKGLNEGEIFDSKPFVGYERPECKSCHESRAETYRKEQEWLSLSDEERGRRERERREASAKMAESFMEYFEKAYRSYPNTPTT